jgi:hypothetical protein
MVDAINGNAERCFAFFKDRVTINNMRETTATTGAIPNIWKANPSSQK